MITTRPADAFEIRVGTLIVGAGACGLVAALAAREAGQDVMVVEAVGQTFASCVV